MIGLLQPNDHGPSDAFDAAAGVELAAGIFRENGLLVNGLGLEYRPQQETMALATAEAFGKGQPLLFEAGTGVGKSLAYLLPGIIRAFEENRPFLVTTHTIALQEQIKDKDLAICRKIFEASPQLEKYAEFRVALLVGRGNYLCGNRLSRAIEAKRELFQSTEQSELQRLVDWMQTSENGLLQELNPLPPPDVWDWVNADSTSCNRRNCQPETCHFQRARARVRNAHIVIINHSLLFTLINAGHSPGGQTPGVLLPNDFLAIDEAHRVPAVATDHFGDTLSSFGLERTLKRLFNPRKNRGLLHKIGNRQGCQLVEGALDESARFFSDIQGRFLLQRDIVRLRKPNWAEATLNLPLLRLASEVNDAAERMEDGPERQEIKDHAARVEGHRGTLTDCLSLTRDDHVYWTERTGRKGQIVTLRAAPVDVAPYIRERVFMRNTSVLLTSATLSEGDNMAAFANRAGAAGLPAQRVTSPFDYARNMRVFVAADAPPPSREEARQDLAWLAGMIAHCALAMSGGTLVLFTSYRDMREAAMRTEPAFRDAGRPFLLHGRDGPRMELTRAFAASHNGILFGTESFWTGVDVPGPALSQVIIVRLPFENPSHPVQEARAEWIRSQGGNPFIHMTLPDAVVRFRQGIGRLIRHTTDRGTVTILDSRIVQKEYGLRFLNVLPQPDYTRFTAADRDWKFQPLEDASE